MKQTAVLVLLCLLIAGCADSITVAIGREPVGFLHGLWHGMIVPVSWFLSLFWDDVAIYAVYNNGGWYDFGFVLGIGGLSGCSCSSKK